MLPPQSMLTIKIRMAKLAGCSAALAMLLTGCGPAGPRALFAGKRLLDQGKPEQAVETLKTAVTLLKTNALAYSYLGLACHQAGKLPEAESAYQHALTLDPELVEVRYNLGCLYLGENKLEPAKTALTAYTLRRPGAADGWLKLGTVQLRSASAATAYARAAELAAAERSFNEVIRLSGRNAEALTGIGLARLQRNRPGEAIQYFDQALKVQPDYPPALLNLAIVTQENLNDRQLALQKYQEYVALKPVPENAIEVRAIIRQLEQELRPAPAHPAQSNPAAQLAQTPVKPVAVDSGRNLALAKTATNVSRPTVAIPLETAAAAPKPASMTNAAKPAAPNPIPASTTLEVSHVPAEPVLKTAQDDGTSPARQTPTGSEHAVGTTTPLTQTKEPQKSFLQKINPFSLLGSDSKAPRTAPPSKDIVVSARSPEEAPLSKFDADSSLPSGARYTYKSPAKPAAGSRAEAERAFAQGVQAQQTQHLPEALQAYRRALQADPSYFDAWYNFGLAATEAGNFQSALSAYETALALRPDSLDARYNFALVLKQANYSLDAARELEKVLAAYPNDSRSHLALGNLYAQQLRQPAKARPHYVKVLESDPRNPQAGAIRYWLTDAAH